MLPASVTDNTALAKPVGELAFMPVAGNAARFGVQAGTATLRQARHLGRRIGNTERATSNQALGGGGVGGRRTRQHTPTSQPQGPTTFKKEGGGGGGGAQATYQKPSNKPASDAGRVEKPSLRENAGEKLKKGVNKEVGGGGSAQGSKPHTKASYSQAADFLPEKRVGKALKDDGVSSIYDRQGKVIKEFPGKAKSHGFPDVVDNYASQAKAFDIPNGKLYQLEGTYNGKTGRFEWIVQDNKVTHRMFIEGGKTNGMPIKK